MLKDHLRPTFGNMDLGEIQEADIAVGLTRGCGAAPPDGDQVCHYQGSVLDPGVAPTRHEQGLALVHLTSWQPKHGTELGKRERATGIEPA